MEKQTNLRLSTTLKPKKIKYRQTEGDQKQNKVVGVGQCEVVISGFQY